MSRVLRLALLYTAVYTLGACVGTPQGIVPVQDFNAQNYMGTWYEIARIENRFERGLQNITANYTLNNDGTVTVLNRGYSTRKQAWKEAKGKAKFVGAQDQGFLKVSFFGPFYGSYVVFEMDAQSQEYAFVASHNRSYLWFLSRTPVVDQQLKDHFKERIEALQFDTSNIVWISQQQN